MASDLRVSFNSAFKTSLSHPTFQGMLGNLKTLAKIQSQQKLFFGVDGTISLDTYSKTLRAITGTISASYGSHAYDIQNLKSFIEVCKNFFSKEALTEQECQKIVRNIDKAFRGLMILKETYQNQVDNEGNISKKENVKLVKLSIQLLEETKELLKKEIQELGKIQLAEHFSELINTYVALNFSPLEFMVHLSNHIRRVGGVERFSKEFSASTSSIAKFVHSLMLFPQTELRNSLLAEFMYQKNLQQEGYTEKETRFFEQLNQASSLKSKDEEKLLYLKKIIIGSSLFPECTKLLQPASSEMPNSSSTTTLSGLNFESFQGIFNLVGSLTPSSQLGLIAGFIPQAFTFMRKVSSHQEPSEFLKQEAIRLTLGTFENPASAMQTLITKSEEITKNGEQIVSMLHRTSEHFSPKQEP
jgi:hypothetical protein